MVRVGYKKKKKVEVRQKIFLGNIFFLQWYIQGYLKMVWQQTLGVNGGPSQPMDYYAADSWEH